MSYEVESSGDKGFFRLQYTDQTVDDPDNGDFDGDGLTNLEEITLRDNPASSGITTMAVGATPQIQTDPLNSDTDGDGMHDKEEQDNGKDPTNPDENGNGIPDGLDDDDGDGTDNTSEIQNGTSIGNDDDFPAVVIKVGHTAQGGTSHLSLPSINNSSYQLWKWTDIHNEYSSPVAVASAVTPSFLSSLLDGDALPDNPQTAPYTENTVLGMSWMYNSCSVVKSQDGSSIDSLISKTRYWLKVPSKTSFQEFKYLKVTYQAVYYTGGTSNTQITSVTPVSFTVPANQRYSDSIDLKKVPTPITGARVDETEEIVPAISVTSANSPTGSAAKYALTPKGKTADNLYAVWPGEEFKVTVNLAPNISIPPGTIHWDVDNISIPNDTREYTFTWSDVGTKSINLTIAGQEYLVMVDVPDVGGISQNLATGTLPPWVVSQIGVWGVYSRDYCNSTYPVSPKRDAIRHSFWCALSVSDGYVSQTDVLYFTTAHEYSNKFIDNPRQQAFNSTMDLWNNYTGSTVNLSYPMLPPTPKTAEILSTLDGKYASGELRIYDGSTSEGASEGVLLNSNKTKIQP